MEKLIVVFMSLFLAAPCVARIITVDNDAPADFNNIQAAIDDANNGDTVEIQPGTYTGPGNRDIDFLGKAITVRSTDPNDPNTVAATIIDCARSGRAFLFQTSEDANSVLDGLTITNGFSDASGGAIYCHASGPTIRNCVMTSNSTGFLDAGGAVYCKGGSSPTISNCLFARNSADHIGGAMYCIQSTATISNSVFRNNSTAGASGGALRIIESSLTISDCTFQDNSAETYGGAINANYSELTIKNTLFVGCSAQSGGALRSKGDNITLANCRFVGNFMRRWSSGRIRIGGGLAAGGGNVSVVNCLFAGNSMSYGGAIAAGCVFGRANMSIVNCTFAGNYAYQGDTLYCAQPSGIAPSDVHIRDSIICDGGDSIVNAGDSKILVTFCDIPSGCPAYGNIDADPCFVDPGNWVHRDDPNIIVEPNNPYAVWVDGDYHLKSQAGRWDANDGRWTNDDVTSPCIDAGDTRNPIGSEPFPNGGQLNMGAYGGTVEASKSYFGKPPCETIVAGDINGDCRVDATDFSFLAGHWLADNTPWPGCATGPYPPNRAKGIPTTTLLSWMPGPGATSHNVYFGTVGPDHLRCNQSTTIYDPGILQRNTWYYWRIDEVYPGGIITGAVWSFQTTNRPDPATYPDPPDGSTGIRLDPVLNWRAGLGTTSHDVYFGTAKPPQFQRNETQTIFTPGTLSELSTYYWRVDEVNDDGKTTGIVWSFTTREEDGGR